MKQGRSIGRPYIARTYAYGSFRLPFDKLRMYGSMVLYLFCISFFAQRGEK
jgi:hypothetical protein